MHENAGVLGNFRLFGQRGGGRGAEAGSVVEQDRAGSVNT